MNIKEAKEELKHTADAYLAKDELGEYRIPRVRQRPVFLIGPPGIGKTQIMEQVAKECRIGLVSYTITHHTRQSAVGLPYIREKTFQGKDFSVTEYTMSEILASIYQYMEDTGLKEGILFIDEINCVSETLAPTMLQFLQRKTFGNQAVPEGWLIIAAGNPPEYNKSVREFDMATLDRARCITVEADYRVWKEYAKSRKIHGALMSYLEIRQNNFYRVEADVDGIQYVTARGWEDFSHLLYAYEEKQLPVSDEVVYEYLHHREVAEDVAAYLDLYRKYQDDYGIGEILRGKVKPSVFVRIKGAAFDERLSVVNLLLDGLAAYFRAVFLERRLTDGFFDFLKSYRVGMQQGGEPLLEYESRLCKIEETFQKEDREGFLDREGRFLKKRLISLLKKGKPTQENLSEKEAFDFARNCFEGQKGKLIQAETQAAQALEYAFDFMEEAFGQGEELVVFVTELSVSREAAAFLSENVCERYLVYNRQLLIGSRKQELLSEIRRE